MIDKEISAKSIETWLCHHFAQILEIEESAIDVSAPFNNYGLPSREMVSLSGELEDWLNVELSPTIAYEYVTIEALAAYLADSVQESHDISLVSSSEPTSSDPIAIVGMGCRFPHASSIDAYWQLLRDGVDAISKVPDKRWGNALPSTMPTWGGFLDKIAEFDAMFFGISPKEAIRVDPQQRLLLEVVWEALEHANIVPTDLAGTQTGVFVGISTQDYSHFQLNSLAHVDAYAGTGNALSISANRLSYLFNLRGPSLAVDTACSSSLVSLHLACQSLRTQESEMAIVGGVNLLVRPELSYAFSQAQMLAPDGRCKTFDARANGYVRGEGCGVVILKRLSDAVRDGDKVLALVRGTAVNQDGRSNGLTAPSGLAQQAVIRQALHNANVSAADVSYIEAHGTGTELGDPIELNALKAVLLAERPSTQACAIGSVKTNIGHLESAAGVAGLIKVVLSLQHEEIPPHLHFQQLNPLISLEETPFYIPTQRSAWATNGHARLAGISSFGFGGTNAHVIVEEAPRTSVESAAPTHQEAVVTLSAKSEPALQELAQKYQAHLAYDSHVSIPDLAATASRARTHFNHRLAIRASSVTTLQAGLTAYQNGETVPHVVTGAFSKREAPRIAFLFTGQGAQYVGMARGLYETEPVFREVLDECQVLLQGLLKRPLRAVLYPTKPDDEALIHQTAYAQPALFAIEYALAKLWQHWGVEPDIVIGHSVGEYVAACVAGGMSLADGLRVIAKRGKLMQALPQTGLMASVFAAEADVRAAIQPYADSVDIAAINGPHQIVISGERDAVTKILAQLEAQEIDSRPLKTSHAFHSPQMASVLDPLRKVVSRVKIKPLAIPLISNVTGTVMPTGQMIEPDYWVNHTRQAVQFVQGVHTLLERGCDIAIEIGPSPTLLKMARRFAPENGVAWLPSLQKDEENQQTVLQTVSELYVRNAPIRWQNIYKNGRFLHLPTYPFQRKHYWIAATSEELSVNKQDPVLETTTEIDANTAVLEHLHKLTSRLLGAQPQDVDIHTPFLELGADSLVLVDAIRLIKEKFGEKISIRQLFEEVTTIDALAKYIAERITPEKLSSLAQPVPAANAPATVPSTMHRAEPQLPTPPPATATPMATPVTPMMSATPMQPLPTGDMSYAQQLINQQIQLFSQMTQVASQQLNMLQQGGASTSVPVPQMVPVAPPPPAQLTASRSPIETEADEDEEAGLSPFSVGKAEAPEKRILPPAQQQYLDAFIAAYTAKTKGSQNDAQSYRPVWADLRSTLGFRPELKDLCYPIVAERSEGSHFWDVDGNRYLDLSMGFGVYLFGHNPAFIKDAIEQQLQRGIHVGPQSDLAGQLSQLICELTGNERVTYCNSGTEAVMTAIRLARAATGRRKIVMFSGSYHGHSDGVLAVSRGERHQFRSMPMASGVLQTVVDDVLVLPYGEENSLNIIREHIGELAAVLVEPVQSRRPNLQPRAFLHALREMTEEAGTTLIFDEVITGFRIHPGGAQHWFGIRADMVTYGKVLGGGMPIGVVAGKSHYLDPVDGGMWQYGDDSYPGVEKTFVAGTFCKHPLAMAASLASLIRMKEMGSALHEALNERTAHLAQTLNTFFQEMQLPIKVVYFGSLFRFSWEGNFSYLYQPLEMDIFYHHLIHNGIYIWEGRTCFLTTAHTDEDVTTLIATVKEVVSDLQEMGFLPNGTKATPERVVSKRITINGTAALPQKAPAATNTYPLSEAQKQLWALAQVSNEGSLAYHVPVRLQISGKLNSDLLSKAVQKVVDHYVALRTYFPDEEGEYQEIMPNVTINLPIIDLSLFLPDVQASQIATLLENENQTPFDLAQPPLLRAILLKISSESYQLILTAHHLVVDGWSMGIIVQDIIKTYTALSQGKSVTFAEAMSFDEYVRWQKAQKDSDVTQEHEAYWVEQFADTIPVLDLPLDFARPAKRSYRGGRVTVKIDRELSHAITHLCQSNQSTLFMGLLSIYALLLNRLTNKKDIVVSTPTGGRVPDDSQHMVGYTAHLMPLRFNVPLRMSFVEWMQTLRGRVLDAYEHQDYPFAWLLNKLDFPKEELPALTSIIFNVERPMQVPEVAGLELAITPRPIYYTAFDFNLNVLQQPEGLIIDLDYNADLFRRDTAERILGYYQNLLQAVVKESDKPLVQLELLDEFEEHRILRLWNKTRSEFRDSECIHQLFEKQVTQSPKATAVYFGDESVTYEILNKRANKIAHGLVKKGVELGSIVALLGDRGIDFLAGMLAIFKAGGVYLPLDPEHPPQRHMQILEHSQPALVLTPEALRSHVQDVITKMEGKIQPPILTFEDPWLKRQRTTNLPIITTPRDLAYIIYTSGSTGMPKGAMIEHRGAINHLHAKYKDLSLSSHDVVIQNASQCFDISIWQHLVLLMIGGQVVITPNDVAHDPVQLVDLTVEREVTVLEVVPSFLRVIIDELTSRGQQRPYLSHLRWLIVTGEALPPDLCYQWFSLYPYIKVVNAYGPTECSDDVTHHILTSDLPQELARVPIGRAVSNTQLYILNEDFQPVPVGVVGELYVGGVGVGRGYLNAPERTAQSFLPDPFSTKFGARLYKTGDLATYLPNGSIEFVGRVDYQVKIRGFRIELGEIETVLRDHPALFDVALQDYTTESGHKYLVAFVVAPEEVDKAELRAFLKERLPDYMVPSVFLQLDHLPLTANGKIDRRSLPVPNEQDVTAVADYVPPSTPEEAQLVTIWGKLLNTETIGVHDNFFDLGGDSILGIQVSARARELGFHVTPKDIFEAPTIMELAQKIGKAPTIVAEQGMVTGSFPLTPIYQWFFEQKYAQPNHYNQALLFMCRYTLAQTTLEQAIDVLLKHHDMLRLRIRMVDNEPKPYILEEDNNIPVSWENISHLSQSEQEVEIEKRANELQASLDLQQGPIMRVAYFDCGRKPFEDRLLIIIHHLAVDGVSWRILIEDLQTICRQITAGIDLQLPAKTTSFKKWAERLKTHAQSPEIVAEYDYWHKIVSAPVSDLQTDYEIETNGLFESSYTHITALSSELTKSLLQEAHRAYNTQISDLLLTALVQTFNQWTQSDSLLLDLESHGREYLFDDLDISRTVSWFTSEYPALLSVPPNIPWKDAIMSIKEQLRQIPQQGLGYGMLRYLTETSTHQLISTKPQLIFNYLGQLDQALTDKGGLLQVAPEAIGMPEGGQNSLSHKIIINGQVLQGKLQMEWTYSRSLYKSETIESLSENFMKILEMIIDHCLAPEVGGYTPSDFKLLNTSQDELSKAIDMFDF